MVTVIGPLRDYDEFGFADSCDEGEPDCEEHCGESEGRTMNIYDDFEETQECHQRDGEPTTHQHLMRNGEAWNHVNQAYVVDRWKWNSEQDQTAFPIDNNIACFFQGERDETEGF